MTEGLSRSGFDIDLREGEDRESAFVKALREVGYLVEHKSDHLARKTGKVFIEYRQKGRPSGINVTTAHFWAIEFDANAWVVIETDRLRWLARKAWQDPLNRKTGGDHNLYEGVTVPVAELVRLDYLATGSGPAQEQGQLDREFVRAAKLPEPLTDDNELDRLFDVAWERTHPGEAA